MVAPHMGADPESMVSHWRQDSQGLAAISRLYLVPDELGNIVSPIRWRGDAGGKAVAGWFEDSSRA